MTTSIKEGNVPVAALLKINKGMLLIPSNYTITKGVSLAFKESLGKENDDLLIYKASFKNNGMTDLIHSNMVKGLMQREDFHSLKTQGNEVGINFANSVVKMIS